MTDKIALRVNDLTSSLGISRATLYRLIKSKEFPKPVRIAPRTSVWLVEDIEKWLRQKNRWIHYKSSSSNLMPVLLAIFLACPALAGT